MLYVLQFGKKHIQEYILLKWFGVYIIHRASGELSRSGETTLVLPTDGVAFALGAIWLVKRTEKNIPCGWQASLKGKYFAIYPDFLNYFTIRSSEVIE